MAVKSGTKGVPAKAMKGVPAKAMKGVPAKAKRAVKRPAATPASVARVKVVKVPPLLCVFDAAGNEYSVNLKKAARGKGAAKLTIQDARPYIAEALKRHPNVPLSIVGTSVDCKEELGQSTFLEAVDWKCTAIVKPWSFDYIFENDLHCSNNCRKGVNSYASDPKKVRFVSRAELLVWNEAPLMFLTSAEHYNNFLQFMVVADQSGVKVLKYDPDSEDKLYDHIVLSFALDDILGLWIGFDFSEYHRSGEAGLISLADGTNRYVLVSDRVTEFQAEGEILDLYIRCGEIGGAEVFAASAGYVHYWSHGRGIFVPRPAKEPAKLGTRRAAQVEALVKSWGFDGEDVRENAPPVKGARSLHAMIEER